MFIYGLSRIRSPRSMPWHPCWSDLTNSSRFIRGQPRFLRGSGVVTAGPRLSCLESEFWVSRTRFYLAVNFLNIAPSHRSPHVRAGVGNLRLVQRRLSSFACPSPSFRHRPIQAVGVHRGNARGGSNADGLLMVCQGKPRSFGGPSERPWTSAVLSRPRSGPARGVAR